MGKSIFASKKPGRARRIIGDVLIALAIAFTIYLSVIMTHRINTVVLKASYISIFRYELIFCAVLLVFALDLRFGFFTKMRFLPLRILGWALRILVLCMVAVILFFAGKVTAGSLIRNGGEAENVIVLGLAAVCALLGLGLALENGQPQPDLLRRLDTARRYLEQHPDSMLLLTGGNPDASGRTEAAVMREILLERGVPEKSMTLEDQAKTTYENFRNIRKLVDPGEPVVLISSDYHMDRAVKTAKNVGFTDILRQPAPSSFLQFGANVMVEIVMEVNDLTLHKR